MRKAQCICRVTGFSLTIQLKMQMCPGGPAALPCCSEGLPGLYGFARTDIDILQMGIHRRCSIRKQKLHAAAIAGTSLCAEHGAVPHRKDAGALGAGKARIIRKHLLTNCIGTLIVTTTLQIPSAIFTESYLSFLGLGVAAPMPSLGSLATDAVKGMNTYPHLLFLPAIIISVTILAFNLFGDGLRDAFDPKLKN